MPLTYPSHLYLLIVWEEPLSVLARTTGFFFFFWPIPAAFKWVPLPFPPSHLGEKRKDPECDNRVPSHAGTSVLATNLMKEFSECLL